MNLVEKNNWENLTYYIDQVEVNIADIKSISLEINDKIETYNTTYKQVSKSYSDHGHTYYATTNKLCIEHDKFGIVPVNQQILSKVVSVEFKS